MMEIDEQLKNAISDKLSRQFSDGLYTVSMDHCPSEQLSKSDWHTTVLVLSCGVEHSDLGKSIGLSLRSNNPTLMKWKNATKQYKKNFPDQLFGHLEKYPVYIFAISANKQTIINNVEFFLEQLQASEKYKLEKVGNKNTIHFGPFYNKTTNKKNTIKLSENRAIMALFIAHFVLRMHRRMWEAEEDQNRPHHLNWNFLADKLPGPSNDDMELMVSILLQRYRDKGRILWGYFKESDVVVTDLLADNIAGMLNDIVVQKYKKAISFKDKNGLFYWEHWEMPPNNSSHTKLY